jgi:hypothetical protein
VTKYVNIFQVNFPVFKPITSNLYRLDIQFKKYYFFFRFMFLLLFVLLNFLIEEEIEKIILLC